LGFTLQGIVLRHETQASVGILHFAGHEVLTSQRNAASRTAARVGLPGFRFVGVEYPKVHDVGDVLTACREKFPAWFASEIPAMSKFSRVMAEKRSAALYGVEASGKTPGEIFNDPEEAEEALKEARRIHELCRRMIL